jgi:hypothetical protein
LRAPPSNSRPSDLPVAADGVPAAHPALLDDLKDTTASIYFVPDMFVTDLIQGRSGSVCGMPVISVCETPFTGTNGLIKRVSDIVLSLLILALISPLLLAIAIAVKLTRRARSSSSSAATGSTARKSWSTSSAR